MQIYQQIESSWKKQLSEEFRKPYFEKIQETISDDLEKNIILYPAVENIFNAFTHTHFNDVKVVILGQDPYHGEAQAHGLSFSVQKGVKIPPSLRNIYKELNNSLDLKMSESGDLTPWADQGVLLLNAVLSVQAGTPASHAKIGWEDFTDAVIKKVSKEQNGVIFLLWGAFAQGKKKFIDTNKHHIIETTHPSPFSAYRGFLGSDCFKETNKLLKEKGKKEINWQI